MRVLSIDPGRQKCGVAVCGPGEVVVHRVVPAGGVAEVARAWVGAYGVSVVLVGNRTGRPETRRSLAGIGVPLVEVEERGTTLAARARYFRDHPPRGWRRLLPRSLLVPPEPYDDYAAILLAEIYLTGSRLGGADRPE